MTLQTKAVWYVYELLDPRDGKTFYVGKGKGNRVAAHEKEAAKANRVCSKKISKIKDIWSAGLFVERRINAFFWDEQSAYDHETDVIDAYSLENLTNVLPGGQTAWTQRKKSRAERKEKHVDIHTLLDSKDEKLFVLFRNWFALGLDAGDKKVAVTCSKEGNGSLYAQVTAIAYNDLLPMLYELIKKSGKAIDKFAKRMEPYNVRIVYGSA